LEKEKKGIKKKQNNQSKLPFLFWTRAYGAGRMHQANPARRSFRAHDRTKAAAMASFPFLFLFLYFFYFPSLLMLTAGPVAPYHLQPHA
jgi:hypothetical protein